MKAVLVFSLSGRPGRMLGKTSPDPSDSLAASASTSSARLDSGTRCSWFAFMRSAGTGHDVRDTLHVGADVASTTEFLAFGGARNGVALSQGHVRDGEGTEDVTAWLRVAASHTLTEGVTGLVTYPEDPPTTIVRLITGGPSSPGTRTVTWNR